MARERGSNLTDLKAARHRAGLRAEQIAAMLLMAKGYRILARRWRTPAGEVDIVAKRGRRLTFVEVKQRLSIEEAHTALTPRQAAQLHAASDVWLAKNASHQECDIGFDAVLIVPWRWPQHIEHAL